MRVPLHIVDARREKLAALIDRHRYLPISELCRHLGVSEATARRDLAALVGMNKVKRTHGGALAEFNDRFLSFKERQTESSASKAAVARAALRFIEPGGVYFMDSGTTIFALAEAFYANPITPVTIVTSNIPVGELLSAVPEVSVFQLAGQILSRQSVIVGEVACRSLGFWKFDIAFLSAEAANSDGIWNTQEIIVRQQTAAIQQSTRVVYCVDRDKIGAKAKFRLRAWEDVDCLLSDASPKLLEASQIPVAKSLGVDCRSLPSVVPPPNPVFPVHFL